MQVKTQERRPDYSVYVKNLRWELKDKRGLSRALFFRRFLAFIFVMFNFYLAFRTMNAMLNEKTTWWDLLGFVFIYPLLLGFLLAAGGVALLFVSGFISCLTEYLEGKDIILALHPELRYDDSFSNRWLELYEWLAKIWVTLLLLWPTSYQIFKLIVPKKGW